MDLDSIIGIMLPQNNGINPHVTHQYGEPRVNGPHKGIDFNYEGGQNGINLTHPNIYSPISGTVIDPVGGTWGVIRIRDEDGSSSRYPVAPCF
jgi:putative chitinase